jgi:Fe-S-cluster containining protein
MDDAGHLRFSCQPGCTKCCETVGYVYFTDDDIARAADFLGLTAAEFEQRYIYRTRYLRRMLKPKTAQCHFLREGGCSIHPVKPVQCRVYPFWPEMVEDRRAWRREARVCPGIGTGDLIQIGDALEVASEMRTAYPAMYTPA